MIKTKRLTLRPFSAQSDSYPYWESTHDDPAIQRYLPYATGFDIDDTQNILSCYQNGDFLHDFYFIIEENSSKHAVGAIIATQDMYSHDSLDVCYMIFKKNRGKGYANESLNAFIEYVQRNHRFRFLLFEVEPSNTISNHIVSEGLQAKFLGVREDEIGKIFRVYQLEL